MTYDSKNSQFTVNCFAVLFLRDDIIRNYLYNLVIELSVCADFMKTYNLLTSFVMEHIKLLHIMEHVKILYDFN